MAESPRAQGGRNHDEQIELRGGCNKDDIDEQH